MTEVASIPQDHGAGARVEEIWIEPGQAMRRYWRGLRHFHHTERTFADVI
jgi:hypothetical protein